MVAVGNYSVRLVNAETKEPFKEHTGPTGKTYSEVEPKVDYFIEIEVIGGDPEKVYVFKYTVDGQNLNYNSPLKLNDRKQLKGLWSYQNGISTTKALSFHRPKFQHDSSQTVSVHELMGKIEVNVYEGIPTGCKRELHTPHIAHVLTQSTLSADLSSNQTKKVLRSKEGSHSESTRVSASWKQYNQGELLESITLNYCTTLGLIRAGVLAAPGGFWGEARLMYPRKRSEKKEIDVKPKRIKFEAQSQDGVTLTPAKECDLFDLSGLASDDDDDDKDN